MGCYYRLEDNLVKVGKKTVTSRYTKLLNCFRFFKISNGFKSTALNTQAKIGKKLNLKVLMNGTTWLFRKYRNTLKSAICNPIPVEITTI